MHLESPLEVLLLQQLVLLDLISLLDLLTLRLHPPLLLDQAQVQDFHPHHLLDQPPILQLVKLARVWL